MACQSSGHKSLKCSAHLSGDCHPASLSFKIQQPVPLGFKDASQSQCRKHTAVAEKRGVECMLLYKKESAQDIQRREDAFPRLEN